MADRPRRMALASANPGKRRELEKLLAARGIELVDQQQLGIEPAAETGLTFVENALGKARHLSRQADLPVIADDSGLVVPALDGAPGLYSSRYAGARAGAGAGDRANNRLLLENMRDLQNEQRRAWFHCTLVCLRHARDPDPLIATARWHGRIADSCRGEHGFGYDPLFIPAGMQQSAACLPPEHKQRVSHRGQALAALLEALPEWWSGPC